jgi:hypothetical protein
MKDVRPLRHGVGMTINHDFPGAGAHTHGESPDTLIIDCDRCSVRGLACTDCVVSVLLGPPAVLDHDSQNAIAVLAGSGLVPPLRLVTQGTTVADSGTSSGTIRARNAGVA